MQMNDYTQQLFPYVDESRIVTLSCGHVIPPSNLYVSPVVAAPNGDAFDFTFSSRNLSTTISNLGESFVRLLPLCPDGTVIFFPSYAYLEKVVAEWKKTNTTGSSIWSRLDSSKPIFMEAQSGTTSAEYGNTGDVLEAYTREVESSSGRGALLLAVVGGKLSEGINFSDHLGRCVIIVGLPYPNPNSPEWKAKMEYIEGKAMERGAQTGTASREFSENVCMRAVNQAIGRAVRHKGDWATILLVDRRYSQKRILEKLPKWIQASLAAGRSDTFGGVQKGLGDFYAAKKTVHHD